MSFGVLESFAKQSLRVTQYGLRVIFYLATRNNYLKKIVLEINSNP